MFPGTVGASRGSLSPSHLPPRLPWPGSLLGGTGAHCRLAAGAVGASRCQPWRGPDPPPCARCGLLNCEVVLELLGRALEDPSDSVRMVSAAEPGRRGARLPCPPGSAALPLSPQRSMCAISALMCSDLLSLDQIFAVTRQHLQQLSQGSPGPVANRATKVTPGASLCPPSGAGHSWELSWLSVGTPSSWEQLCACPRGTGIVCVSQGVMLRPQETRASPERGPRG